jgi:hypothetical protein
MSRISVGDKYEMLTVLELIPDKKNPKAKCLCDCGNECTPQRGALKNGRATSCGCRRAKDFIKRATTHGMSKTPTYKIWRGMIQRCTNKNVPEYKNYGGRGIQVKWKSFEEFFADMGEKPSGMWIDRIDNDGHYEEGNCAWVAPRLNSENKRTSKVWVINGTAYKSSVEAAKTLKVDPSVIVRGCNGFVKNGKYHPPISGWGCYFRY